MSDKLLSVKEIAKILGVSDRTVREYIYNESLPAIQVKKRYRIKRTDLDNWLEVKKRRKK